MYRKEISALKVSQFSLKLWSDFEWLQISFPIEDYTLCFLCIVLRFSCSSRQGGGRLCLYNNISYDAGGKFAIPPAPRKHPTHLEHTVNIISSKWCFSIAFCADDWIIFFFTLNLLVESSNSQSSALLTQVALNVYVCWMRHLSLIWTKIRPHIETYAAIQLYRMLCYYFHIWAQLWYALCVWMLAGRWFSGAWFQWILKRNSSIIGLWR